jgi:hypothetical protein
LPRGGVSPDSVGVLTMARNPFPDDEDRLPWLAILLDSYAIADEANAAVLADCSRRQVDIACHKGCDSCCQRPSVPVCELELLGIEWFVVEKLAEPARSRVVAQLLACRSTPRCPFLIEGACGIHPVRPLICRQFFVRSRPCSPGEDVMQTRPQDVVLPPLSSARRIAMRLLDHYGFRKPSDKLRAFERGFVGQNSRLMINHDWSAVSVRMKPAAPFGQATEQTDPPSCGSPRAL